VTALLVTSKMVTKISYTPAQSGLQKYLLPVYTTDPARCLQQYTLEIEYMSNPALEHKWISHDGTFVSIRTDDLTLKDEYRFKVVARIDDVINDEVFFLVSFDCVITDIIAPGFPT
jgi:hypothetical protein